LKCNFTTWPKILSVDPDVRIVNGNATCGRLEVEVFADVWSPVCPTGFDDVDATIACRDFGFGYVCVRAVITMMRRGTIA